MREQWRILQKLTYLLETGKTRITYLPLFSMNAQEVRKAYEDGMITIQECIFRLALLIN